MMERLWAPWRMPYIEQFEAEPGCLFCNRAHDPDDEKNYIVHRGAACFVMLNLYPYNSGHLMVAPYQHTGDIAAVEPETSADLMYTMQLAVQALDRVMKPNGYNMGINQGRIAGAGVDSHIHLHVVPRWDGDTNFMPVLADAKVIPELLTRTAGKLRPVFAELSRTQ